MMCESKRIIRVFFKKTRSTPDDELARIKALPVSTVEADEVICRDEKEDSPEVWKQSGWEWPRNATRYGNCKNPRG